MRLRPSGSHCSPASQREGLSPSATFWLRFRRAGWTLGWMLLTMHMPFVHGQTATPTAKPTAQPAGPQSDDKTPEFADEIQELIASHDGQVAVSIITLDNQDTVVERWQVAGERVMPTASLIKLPIMLEAYRQAAEGNISLDDMLELGEEDKVPGSGILTEHFSAGTKLSIRDAIRLMIRYSDNTATNLVVKKIGIAATSRFMRQLGYPETQLHSLVYRRDTSIAPERSQLYGLGSTTANDMSDLLLRLHRGQLVSQPFSAEMLAHLRTCEDTKKLPRFLPASCQLAHKTGSVNRSRTAAGIVSSDSGTFIIAVLTDQNEDTSWGEANAAEILIGEIARIVFASLTAPSETIAGPQPLAEGAQGEKVEALQRTLNARLGTQLAIDGDFGPATAAAVRQFQSAHGIEATGVMDQRSWQQLGELLTEPEPVDPPAEVNARIHSRSPALDPNGPPEVSAKAWAILDANSGKLLHGSQADQPLDMASTTKVMTAYLVAKLAADEPQVLDEIVTFSTKADATIGSTSGVRAGEQLTVYELLHGLLLPSGNDASVALAEHFGDRLGDDATGKAGKIDDGESTADERYHHFVNAMNVQAQRLGLENTRFENPHGLTETGHHSSAADLARLARAAFELPLMREIVACQERGCTLHSVDGYQRNVVWTNTNRLLSQEGFLGMKTGTTQAAGACLIAIGEYQDKRHIVVVLGSQSSDARYQDARNLFAWTWRQ